jgi:hypothetical protein
MFSDYAALASAATMIAVTIIGLATFGMTMLAVLFMQCMLEMGEFSRRVSVMRVENFAVNDATTLASSRELAGD